MTRGVAFVAACLAVLAVAPWAGGPLHGEAADFVWWSLRVPRVALGALVGGSLALVGAAYQALFDNPLATPSTTGTTGGAALGALAILVLGAPPGLAGQAAVAVGAALGAGLATAAVVVLAWRPGTRLEDVLLGGIAVTLAAGALSAGLQATADAATTYRAVRWSLGDLTVVGSGDPTFLAAVAAVPAAALLLAARPLQVLVGGEARAATQGVDVRRLRVRVLAAGAALVGASVALAGPIAFVGLVVPHAVRRTLGASRRVLLPGSALGGAAFLVACDAAARALSPDRTLPVGVITAALGAPMLLALVARRARP